jgi:hypothetical protein
MTKQKRIIDRKPSDVVDVVVVVAATVVAPVNVCLLKDGYHLDAILD